MAEPFGNKWKQYKIWPSILGQGGNTVEKIKLNIGDPSSLQGVQGVQGTTGTQGITGTQGTTGNPNMLLTSPDGSLWKIEVNNQGYLYTVAIPPA
tara:strand:+ start:154 stop:438 length:285 start_codon:yes stop_codon:yes gene_type:complete